MRVRYKATFLTEQMDRYLFLFESDPESCIVSRDWVKETDEEDWLSRDTASSSGNERLVFLSFFPSPLSALFALGWVGSDLLRPTFSIGEDVNTAGDELS